MHNIFAAETTALELHCGAAVTGHGAGTCKNPSCQRRSPSLLSGYCVSCASAKGLNPMKACGCQPIRLTDAAAVASSN
ncbi:MAG: hypothetical protein K2X27_11930 [Candidatus Obscuribacterales bacterium]|nr:hypothetical protein [Candidatus Obscuribacterales bacterium]